MATKKSTKKSIKKVIYINAGEDRKPNKIVKEILKEWQEYYSEVFGEPVVCVRAGDIVEYC
jgi:hypothetical protein